MATYFKLYWIAEVNCHKSECLFGFDEVKIPRLLDDQFENASWTRLLSQIDQKTGLQDQNRQLFFRSNLQE